MTGRPNHCETNGASRTFCHPIGCGHVQIASENLKVAHTRPFYRLFIKKSDNCCPFVQTPLSIKMSQVTTLIHTTRTENDISHPWYTKNLFQTVLRGGDTLVLGGKFL